MTTSRESVGRNDPCPCGSGKKYKQCHLDQPFEEEVEQAKADMRLPMILTAIALVLSIAVGVSKDPGSGAIVMVACLLGIGGFMVLRKPPGPNEHGGDPGGINFGR